MVPSQPIFRSFACACMPHARTHAQQRLGRYHGALVAIGATALQHLREVTDDDLSEIGMPRLHRRTLLKRLADPERVDLERIFSRVATGRHAAAASDEGSVVANTEIEDLDDDDDDDDDDEQDDDEQDDDDDDDDDDDEFFDAATPPSTSPSVQPRTNDTVHPTAAQALRLLCAAEEEQPAA